MVLDSLEYLLNFVDYEMTTEFNSPRLLYCQLFLISEFTITGYTLCNFYVYVIIIIIIIIIILYHAGNNYTYCPNSSTLTTISFT